MTAHEPNPDQRRTSLRQSEIDAIGQGQRPVKPAKPPTAPSPLGKLDVEALESQRAHERDLAQPARPVEDREPVGPYAPNRTGPTIDRDGNITYPNPVGEAAEAINGKINALTDVMGERFDTLSGALHDLMVAVVGDESEGGEPLVTKGFADAEFERGRQQGDADRAQRGQTEFERGRASVQRSPVVTSELEGMFERGMKMGQAKREEELLGQGWTPPGAVHELEVTSYPTEYEVWRDALTLSATNVFPIGGTGEASTFDDDRRAQILADAEFFRDKLINHPTISPAEADQAADDQIRHIDGDHIDGDETSWGPGAKIPTKETPGAEADWSGLTD